MNEEFNSSLDIQDFHTFSRENYQTERDQCAEDIRKARQEYFNHTAILGGLIESNAEHIDSTIKRAAEYSHRIELLQAEADKIKSSLIRIIFLGWLARHKESEIQKNLARYDENKKFLQSLLQSKTDLEEELKRERELKRYRQIYSDFIQDQRKLYTDYIEESGHKQQVSNRQIELDLLEEAERSRDVRYVCKQHNAVMVHVFAQPRNAESVPEGNRRVKKGTLQLDKLKIVCAIQPCLSASSLREGDDADLTVDMGGPGVIVADGVINLAAPHDANTKVDESGQRISQYSSTYENFSDEYYESLNVITPERIRAALGVDLVERRREHNEISVSNAAPGAIYVPEILVDGKFQPVDTVNQFLNFAHQVGLPGYFLSDGRWYRAVKTQTQPRTSWDSRWQKGEEVKIPEILDSLGYIPTSIRKELNEEIEAKDIIL